MYREGNAVLIDMILATRIRRAHGGRLAVFSTDPLAFALSSPRTLGELLIVDAVGFSIMNYSIQVIGT